MEVLIETILYWFIDGQTHFSMPRGAKINVALNESNGLLFIQIQSLPLSMNHKGERNYWYGVQNNQWKIIGDQLPTESSRGYLYWLGRFTM